MQANLFGSSLCYLMHQNVFDTVFFDTKTLTKVPWFTEMNNLLNSILEGIVFRYGQR